MIPPNIKPMTLSQIKAWNEDAGGKFFARATLRGFGETMRSYHAGAMLPDGRQLIHRVGPSKAGRKTFVYDHSTARISTYVEPTLA